MITHIPEQWVSRPTTEVALDAPELVRDYDTNPDTNIQVYEGLLERFAEHRGVNWVSVAGVEGYAQDVDAMLTESLFVYEGKWFLPKCERADACTRKVSIVSGTVAVECAPVSFASKEEAEQRDVACGSCHIKASEVMVDVMRLRAIDIKASDMAIRSFEKASAEAANDFKVFLDGLL